MSTSEPNFEDKNMLFASVEEEGVALFTVTDGRLDIIVASWKIWDAMLVHISKQRAEIEKEVAAGKPVAQATLKMPNFNEIDFKNFPR
jgi:hypothetical protein